MMKEALALVKMRQEPDSMHSGILLRDNHNSEWNVTRWKYHSGILFLRLLVRRGKNTLLVRFQDPNE